MKYIIDNDLHIHTILSSCASDVEQTPENILKFATENGIKTICLTDHFWDDAVDGASEWYAPQNYEHIASSKPLPKAENVRFLFGCETELNKNLTLGVSKEKLDLFDFIIIPTTHFHMTDYTLTVEDAKDAQSKADAWVKRFDYVLSLNLPFHKVGLAHLTCSLIAHNDKEYLKVLELIPDEEMERLFLKAAELGVGIELNGDDMNFSDEEAEIILRPYKIAKKCGCKFYLGSDAHSQKKLYNKKAIFERAIDLLELTEDDKFIIG